MTPEKTYIGDSIYIAPGSYQGEFILTTEDGIRVLDIITFGPTEFSTLLRILERWGWFKLHEREFDDS